MLLKKTLFNDTLLKCGKKNFFQDHCGRNRDQSNGNLHRKERLDSTPNTARQVEIFGQEVGSIEDYKEETSGQGRFWLNQPKRILAEDKPGWTDTTWRWWRMKSPVKKGRSSCQINWEGFTSKSAFSKEFSDAPRRRLRSLVKVRSSTESVSLGSTFWWEKD